MVTGQHDEHAHHHAAVEMQQGYPYEDNNNGGLLMSFRDRNGGVHSSMDFMNGSSNSSSSMEHAAGMPNAGNGFNQGMGMSAFLDETAAMWATVVEPDGMGGSIEMPHQHLQQQGLGQEEVVGLPAPMMMNGGAAAVKGADMMDVSSAVYGTAGPTTAFDLELMESCGMFYSGAGHGIGIDQLQWDC
jgi:myb proto-oncogene protein